MSYDLFRLTGKNRSIIKYEGHLVAEQLGELIDVGRQRLIEGRAIILDWHRVSSTVTPYMDQSAEPDVMAAPP